MTRNHRHRRHPSKIRYHNYMIRHYINHNARKKFCKYTIYNKPLKKVYIVNIWEIQPNQLIIPDYICILMVYIRQLECLIFYTAIAILDTIEIVIIPILENTYTVLERII